MQCYNCEATITGVGGQDSKGRWVCCPHCVFNPLGCRCRFGEHGVPETYLPDPLVHQEDMDGAEHPRWRDELGIPSWVPVGDENLYLQRHDDDTP